MLASVEIRERSREEQASEGGICIEECKGHAKRRTKCRIE